MLGVGKALYRLRADVTYPGAPGCSITTPDADDEDWLPIIAAERWVVLMRDKRIRRRPGEKSKFVEHGVVAFVFTGAGNMTKWNLMRLLVRHWDRIEELADMPEPGPRMYRVVHSGVEQIDLDAA
jgi:hypothetical protein